MRNGLAVIRGLALFGLALAGLPLLVVTWLTRVVGFVHPIQWGRALPNLARRLAHSWSNVDIPSPYRPRPAPPTRGPDGLYRAGSVLYKRPYWPAYHDRTEWLNKDPATWRDDLWLLLNPVVGGALALLPIGVFVVAGYGASRLPWWIGVFVVGAGVLAGLAVAPLAIHGHGRWTALLLRPAKRFTTGYGLGLVRALALAGLSLLGVAMLAVTVAGLVLTFGLGLIFVFPPVIEHFRWLPDLRRQLARDWSGVDVPTPYRPKPPPPEPDEYGRYREGSQVYRTARVPAFNQRWNWLFKDPATWRDLLWMLLDPVVVGLPMLLCSVLIWVGLWDLTLRGLLSTLSGRPTTSWYGLFAVPSWLAIVGGLVVAVLSFIAARPLVGWHGRWTGVLLAPTARARLDQRVRQLTETRAAATDAQAAELRRIERDLHDGAQARLVAVGLSLSTIEALIDRDPVAAKALVAQTRESSARALRELRDLVRGIHPPVLAERGLGDAVRALALDGPLPATVEVDLPGRVPAPIESAVYFAVAEALANAARHADASAVRVDLRHREGVLRVTVTDDGPGGADPARGTGLHGIASRLGTFDGVLDVRSPRGGPTTLTMEVPCASSSPRTSTS